ncbi:DUF6680 family protein [Methylobacterium sp. Leaf87]|uniref:DUF6680 family protein n=1 Tax=Methylobacterium sp. Leaf87 TaxID=1736243 RepID=UPI000ACEA82D|nr:DUF6680 family protein [Methylobacterium sp. Leaf87]
MNPASDVFGWAILIATFIGPVAAVYVTRLIDKKRENYERKMRIFRILMGNRAAGLNAETIQALNLIEIDFQKCAKVLSAWKDYFENLRAEMPSGDRQQAFFVKRQHLYAALLDQIAKVVGYNFEQLHILEGGYYPTGAAKSDADQNAIRELFAGIANGERVLPIAVTNLPASIDQASEASTLRGI